jgi:hypothetical protein
MIGRTSRIALRALALTMVVLVTASGCGRGPSYSDDDVVGDALADTGVACHRRMGSDPFMVCGYREYSGVFQFMFTDEATADRTYDEYKNFYSSNEGSIDKRRECLIVGMNWYFETVNGNPMEDVSDLCSAVHDALGGEQLP